VPELAERLRVKASWVYGHADELGVLRLGKYLRFSWARVMNHLAGASDRQFKPESHWGPSPTTFTKINRSAGLEDAWNK
jgi:hypothetical protein